MKGSIASEFKALRNPKLRTLAVKTLLLRPLYVFAYILCLPAVAFKLVSLAAGWVTDKLARVAVVAWWLDDKIDDYYIQAMKEKQND